MQQLRVIELLCVVCVCVCAVAFHSHMANETINNNYFSSLLLACFGETGKKLHIATVPYMRNYDMAESLVNCWATEKLQQKKQTKWKWQKKPRTHRIRCWLTANSMVEQLINFKLQLDTQFFPKKYLHNWLYSQAYPKKRNEPRHYDKRVKIV